MPNIPRFVPYAAVIAFAIWCALSLRGDLAQVSLEPLLRSWDIVLLAAVLSLLNYVFRALRWRTYLRKLGHSLPRGFVALTYVAGFAYTLSPGKVGEMVRARYYLPLGVPLTDVAAAFFAERLLDLVAMVVLSALMFSADSRYAPAIISAAGLVVVVLVMLAIVPWPKLAAQARSWEWLPRALRAPVAGGLAALVATRPLLRPGILAWGFLGGVIAWGLEGAGLGLLGSIYSGVHLPLQTAVGIYGVAVLIGGLSLLPGGLGSTEAVMTALLIAHGFPISKALLLTLTCRLVTLWFAVCLGWIAVLLLRPKSLATET